MVWLKVAGLTHTDREPLHRETRDFCLSQLHKGAAQSNERMAFVIDTRCDHTHPDRSAATDLDKIGLRTRRKPCLKEILRPNGTIHRIGLFRRLYGGMGTVFGIG